MTRNRRIVLMALIAALTGFACGCTRAKQPTPPDVQAGFHALLDTLSVDTPGESAELLSTFLKSAQKYEIADSAQVELNLVRAETTGRYLKARELARDGEFDRAEHMLQDLARAPGMPDGQSARTHLEFEFYIEKAKSLLVRQRFEEARAVAQELLTRDLSRFQIDEVEKILDYAGHVDAAMEMVSIQDARNACRQLIVLLANVFVNEGTYPPSLSLADMDRLEPYGTKSITRTLASIDDYKVWQDHYSLVAVSKGGQRFRIVDGQLED